MSRRKGYSCLMYFDYSKVFATVDLILNSISQFKYMYNTANCSKDSLM